MDFSCINCNNFFNVSNLCGREKELSICSALRRISTIGLLITSFTIAASPLVIPALAPYTAICIGVGVVGIVATLGLSLLLGRTAKGSSDKIREKEDSNSFQDKDFVTSGEDSIYSSDEESSENSDIIEKGNDSEEELLDFKIENQPEIDQNIGSDLSINKEEEIQNTNNQSDLFENIEEVCQEDDNENLIEDEEQDIELLITTYNKGECKTSDLVPCKKKWIGKGVYGKVFIHRKDSSLVVKKARHLKEEFEIGMKLNSPYIVKPRALYIKNYDNPHCNKQKLVMERIQGDDLKYHHNNNININSSKVVKILEQLKECSIHLFEKKIGWQDLNGGNIFITDSGVKLCDLSWMNVEDENKLIQVILGGATEVVYRILSFSEKQKVKYNSIFPQDFFGEEITFRPTKFGWFFVLSDYMTKQFPEKVAEYGNNKAQLLNDYFDAVIAEFEAADND